MRGKTEAFIDGAHFARKILIGVPCFNAEQSIAGALVQLKAISKTIMICDDGSTDRTREIARALGCRIISHSRHLGKIEALSSILLAAAHEKPDVLVTLELEEVDPLFLKEDLQKLIQAVLDQECDLAVGAPNPLDKDQDHYLAHHRTVLFTDSFGTRIENPWASLRAYNKETLSKLTTNGESVSYDKLLACAIQKGLVVKQMYRLTPSKAANKKREPTEPQAVPLLEMRREKSGGLSRFLNFITYGHPLLFSTIPAMVLLAAALFFGVLTLLDFIRIPPDFYSQIGVTLSLGTLIPALTLGLTSIVLISMKSYGPNGTNN